MKIWIFNCKEVSHLVSESMDHKIGFSKKMGIRFHLMMCKHCARFENQLTIIRKLLKTGTTDATPLKMDRETKKKITQSLKEHRDHDQ
jgi:hypothetical protein